MKSLTATAALWGLVWSASASAQPAPQPPKDLEVLSHFVGNWTSEVINKPAVWDPSGTTFRTINQAEWILDGWFLEHIEVNHVVGDPERVGKALMVWTYDAPSSEYVAWTFHSTGIIGQWTGTWDAQHKAFTMAATNPPPNTTGTITKSFPDAGSVNGNLTFIGDDGQTLMDLVWTRKRQAGVAGESTRDQWANIGTPIEPLPEELKRLEPLIGEWDSEFIHRPSVLSPEGRTSNGRMTAQWILDGRFLLGTAEEGNYRSMWVIGYDIYRQAFRYIRLTNRGQIDESTGQWNDDIRSFVWKVVNERPGITRTSTTRIVGQNAVQAHILAEDNDGKVHLDLTIRSTRRK